MRLPYAEISELYRRIEELERALAEARAELAHIRDHDLENVSALVDDMRQQIQQMEDLRSGSKDAPDRASEDRGTQFDRKRFEQAPCYLCGYNGQNYFQPYVHACAVRYHDSTETKSSAGPSDNEGAE